VTQKADEALRGHRARWIIQEPIPGSLRDRLGGLSVMAAHLLWCRGYRTAEEIEAFFTRGAVMHDPFLLPAMDAAVDRIGAAAAAGEQVAVYGDFDCDGLTATAVLAEALRSLGCAVQVVIPTREEGHGLHTERLAAMADVGVELVVTADCGVTAMEEVQVARGMGMDIVITDHHEPRLDGSLPDCPTVAPTRLDSMYPCRFLSGVGVAFKVAQALGRHHPDKVDVDGLLDLVALGTVADVVPLRDENRALVVRGLERLKRTPRIGLRALFRAAAVDARRIDPTAIGFYLAPRINAANRVATPQTAYDLIAATDEGIASGLASELHRLNMERQALLTRTFEQVVAEMAEPGAVVAAVRDGSRPPVLIVLGSWPAGISGLLANRLVEAYGLPAFVGAEGENGIVSVSARGTKAAAIDLLIESCEASQPGGLFLGYGGHARAGGFRIQSEQLDLVRSLLETEARRQVSADEIGSFLTIDAEVRLSQMTRDAARTVAALGPFGVEFDAPVFLSRNVELRDLRPVGDGSHARLTVQQGATRITGVFFNAPPELLALRPGTRLDLAFNLQLDEWEGLQRVQLRVCDWRDVSPEP
jgi:single-stranded-DNA-specific exonuclease